LTEREHSRDRARQAIARATHNARPVDLSARIRREVCLGFDSEPYTTDVRYRALDQHPRLANAVIASDPAVAGDFAASHARFS
jgi:GntR family transcriptional regulator, transcriptional repressor for pyruvate dehydrogenase complex